MLFGYAFKFFGICEKINLLNLYLNHRFVTLQQDVNLEAGRVEQGTANSTRISPFNHKSLRLVTRR